jgi:pyruvate dehydrogenase E2 component (dihydrolipoamide acetyltransferase)
MAADVIMPALGMAQDTGKVLRWLKAEGDEVAKGEALLEIETDKVTVEVESPAAGVLDGICAAEGEDVAVGRTIAFVLAAGEQAAAPARRALASPKARRMAAEHGIDLAAGEQAAAPARRALASPKARRMAAEHGIDLAAGEQAAAPARRALASPKARRMAVEHGIDLAAVAGSGPGGAVVAADVSAAGPDGAPVSRIWGLMAERTTASWQSVPHIHLRREVDASRLESWRRVARARPGYAGVSHTDLLVRLAAESLRRHPRVNSTWRDGTVVASERIGIGIAVAVADGLVVPVVHDADRLSLAETAARRLELVEAARGGRLRPEDVAGGTFTVSNLGMYGVDSFDAIVNAPQAAILAVGRIADRIVPVGGQPAVRRVLQLSVGFDHRVVDGARAAEFLRTLASLVEEPAGLVD